MTREEIAEYNPDAIIWDYPGYDEAIIGMAENCGFGPVVAYDTNKIIEILMERDGMTDEEAWEYFDYNINGAHVGKNTPIHIFNYKDI